MKGQFKSENVIIKKRVDEVARYAADVLSNNSNLTLDCLQTMKGCYQRLIKQVGEERAKKLMASAITEAFPRLKNTSTENEDLNRKVAKLFNGIAAFNEDRHFAFPKVHRRDRKIDEYIQSLPEEKVEDFLTELQNGFAAKKKEIMQDNKKLSAIWQDRNNKIFNDEIDNSTTISIKTIDRFLEMYKSIKREDAPGGDE